VGSFLLFLFLVCSHNAKPSEVTIVRSLAIMRFYALLHLRWRCPYFAG
jgi:hypothetical protein